MDWASADYKVNDAFGVRADLNAVALSRSESDSSATYQGNLHLAAVGVFADYHPWGNGFRVSAGALIGDSYLDGTAVTSTLTAQKGQLAVQDIKLAIFGGQATAHRVLDDSDAAFGDVQHGGHSYHAGKAAGVSEPAPAAGSPV